MRYVKKLFLVLASLFMVKLVIDQLRFAVKYPSEELSVWGALFLGFFLSLTLTGIFAFVGFTFPTSRLLPATYYQIGKPKRLKRLASVMQLKVFRNLLLIFFWGGNNRKRFFNGKRSGLQSMMQETRQAEFGHLGGLILTIPISVFLLIRGFYIWCLVLQVFNLFGNFYPIILQRVHRLQIQRMLDIGQ